MRNCAQLLALALFLCLPLAVMAQPFRGLQIESVRIGLPAGSQNNVYKIGEWLPVYIRLFYQHKEGQPERITPGQGDIIVETMDNDNLPCRYTVPWPALTSGDPPVEVMAYARPGGDNVESKVTVILRDATGNSFAPREGRVEGRAGALPAGAVLYLQAGSRLSALKDISQIRGDPKEQELLMQQNKIKLPQPGVGKPEGENKDEPGEKNDEQPLAVPDEMQHHAYVNDVRDLPTQWYGYAAVDVMFLTTGQTKFVEALLTDTQNRKEALAEWVSRGGKLVISVGHNHQLAKSLFEKMPLLPQACSITGSIRMERLEDIEKWCGTQERFPPAASPIETAVVTAGQGIEALTDGPRPNKPGSSQAPVLLQFPHGLGRVILIAFDLDQAPFTSWRGKEQFYKQLVREIGPTPPAKEDFVSYRYNQQIGAQMTRHLEEFEEVSVVSFGWVALFIFLYVLVVGPLEFFFLKYVVKRMELAWITFPAIVVAISSVAYVTAYALKGRELKIREVDLIDVVCTPAADAPGSAVTSTQAYGTVWFSLFSRASRSMPSASNPRLTGCPRLAKPM